MTAEAVLVDIVVRDKKGRPVTDLKQGEVEVFEDGVKQDIRGFGFVQQALTSERQDQAESQRREAAPPPISSLDHINLVTLIFDGLSLEARSLALQACEEFVKGQLHQNMVVSVFTIDRRLHVVQQFTNRAELVREAVKRATGRTFTQYLEQSDAIRRELEKLTTASAGVDAAASTMGRDSSSSGPMGAAAAQAALASMTLESLSWSEAMEREQQGMASLNALMGLIEGQRRLAGRKTVIYFSEGLIVPPMWVSLLRSVISEANRSNLSFYAIDARGLTSGGLLDSSRGTLSDAATVSRSQAMARAGGVTRSQVMGSEDAEKSIRMNAQGTLEELSRSTGGFLIAQSNDLRLGVRQVGEDVRGYYEVSYRPGSMQYDGKFRAISVKVSRPDVSVQSRSGYFALPPLAGAGPNISAFEVPLLAILSSPTLAKDVSYRSQLLRYATDSQRTQYVLVVEVPLREITFQEAKDASGKATYRMRFAVLSLIKDSAGQVVEKLSQDYPVREIPADQIEAMRRGNLVFVRQVSLSPGRHTVETVVREEETEKAGAKKTVLMVPDPQSGLRLSSLTTIRRVDKVTPEDLAKDNPLAFADGKVVPTVGGDPIAAGRKEPLGLYLVLYPDPAVPDPPKLFFELAQNGVSIGRSELPLARPDNRGRIQHIATLPVESLKPGEYEIRAIAAQGAQSVEEQMIVRVQ